MAKTWRQAIQKYGSLGTISFEKAFRPLVYEKKMHIWMQKKEPTTALRV
jgi:hypothetical protein